MQDQQVDRIKQVKGIFQECRCRSLRTRSVESAHEPEASFPIVQKNRYACEQREHFDPAEHKIGHYSEKNKLDVPFFPEEPENKDEQDASGVIICFQKIRGYHKPDDDHRHENAPVSHLTASLNEIQHQQSQKQCKENILMIQIGHGPEKGQIERDLRQENKQQKTQFVAADIAGIMKTLHQKEDKDRESDPADIAETHLIRVQNCSDMIDEHRDDRYHF